MDIREGCPKSGLYSYLMKKYRDQACPAGCHWCDKAV
jgi:hypothetical protein